MLSHRFLLARLGTGQVARRASYLPRFGLVLYRVPKWLLSSAADLGTPSAGVAPASNPEDCPRGDPVKLGGLIKSQAPLLHFLKHLCIFPLPS